MAQMTAFRYLPGSTFLHSHDVRYKLAEMVLFTLVTAGSGPVAQTVVNAFLVLALVLVRIPIGSLLRSLRWFFIFLIFILAVRALSTPGSALASGAGLALTREGLVDGLLICWRLIGIVLLSLLFVATTKPPEVKSAVQWLLKPVPWVPERRVAVMMSLMIRFIPVLLQQARDLRDALAARGIGRSRNPLRRLRFIALPLLKRVLLSADRLTLAMTARCYSEARTPLVFSPRPADHLVFSVAILCCSIVHFL